MKKYTFLKGEEPNDINDEISLTSQFLIDLKERLLMSNWVTGYMMYFDFDYDMEALEFEFTDINGEKYESTIFDNGRFVLALISEEDTFDDYRPISVSENISYTYTNLLDYIESLPNTLLDHLKNLDNTNGNI
jgi:hypothetical protein